MVSAGLLVVFACVFSASIVVLLLSVPLVALVSAMLLVSLMSHEYFTPLPQKISTASVLYSRVKLSPSGARSRGALQHQNN